MKLLTTDQIKRRIDYRVAKRPYSAQMVQLMALLRAYLVYTMTIEDENTLWDRSFEMMEFSKLTNLVSARVDQQAVNARFGDDD